MELPKCSKSLHFVEVCACKPWSCLDEQRTKRKPGNCGSVWVSGARGRKTGFPCQVLPGIWRRFGPSCAPGIGYSGLDERSPMNGARQVDERRKWARLPLAIPVFVRTRDGKGKEFLEFATSLNVSAGGMLVAIRRSLPSVAQIRLEIPSAPVAAMAPRPRAARTLVARTLRTTPADGYYLLGLKFSRPLPLASRRNVQAARQGKMVAKL